MSMIDKLKFWKKEDDFGDLGLGDDPFSSKSDGTSDFGLHPETQAHDPGLPPSDPSFDGASPDLSQSPDMSTPPQNKMAGYPASPQNYPQTHADNSMDSVILTKNLEIISSKLDALRASIDSLTQRVSNIERIATSDESDRRSRNW